MPQVKRISKENILDRATAKKRAQSGAPPAPFTVPPPELEPFLETLDITHVYITHVDRFPARFKQRIFTVPVLLNLAIFILLVWRAWAIIPTYFALLKTMLGHESSQTVDPAAHTNSQLIWLVVTRGANFMLDFVLVRVIMPWPLTFFLESPANPVSWRWRIGFRDEEIVVRESRKWGTEELMRGVKVGDESPFWKTRVLPGVDKMFVRSKTGYMMMDKDWDLDFWAMIQAHRLVGEGKLRARDFEKSVFAWCEGTGWVCWQVYKLDEAGAADEERTKIVLLKDKLTAMGKESLFFRWIEIVQYESGREGGFTIERQKETLEKVKEAFAAQGVDFEELMKEVGGLEGTPGMEGVS